MAELVDATGLEPVDCNQSYLFEPSWMHQNFESIVCLGVAQVVEHLIWDQEVARAGLATETKTNRYKQTIGA